MTTKHFVPMKETSGEEFHNSEIPNVIGPVLRDFRNTMEEIRLKEVSRHLKKYKGTPADAALIGAVSKSMMNKVIMIPAVKLNESCSQNGSELSKLSHALATFFNLANVRKPLYDHP